VDVEEQNSRTAAKTANFELLDDALFKREPLPGKNTVSASFYSRGVNATG
jgi:hypothetical protein